MLIETIAHIVFVVSRASVIILSATSFPIWTLVVLGFHFILMNLWIMLWKKKNKELTQKYLLSLLLSALILCFCNPELKSTQDSVNAITEKLAIQFRRQNCIGPVIDGFLLLLRKFSMRESRRDRFLFYFLIIIENFILVILHSLLSSHAQSIRLSGAVFVCAFTLTGSETGGKAVSDSSVETGSKMQNEDIDDKLKTTTDKPSSELPNIETSSSCQLNESQNNSIDRCGIYSDEPDLQPLNKEKETMRSIQDLLANTSLPYKYEKPTLDKSDSVEASVQNCSATSGVVEQNHGKLSNASFHQVGVPVNEGDFVSHSSRSSLIIRSSTSDKKESSNPLQQSEECLASSKENDNGPLILAASHNDALDEAVRTVTVNGSQDDYENIYDAIDGHSPFVRENQFPITKDYKGRTIPSVLVDDSVTTQSSAGSHDYENIPSVNVYRAATGVRHWKTYFDIEDKIHDFSTFKERSLIQDSTLNSNLYSNLYLTTEVSGGNPLSFSDNGPTNFSISLPDLSNIKTEIYLDGETTEAYRVNFPSDAVNKCDPKQDDSVPNYETIWYSYSDGKSQSGSHNKNGSSSIVATISGLKDKESLCNLYYSSLADLSSKYFDSQWSKIHFVDQVMISHVGSSDKNDGSNGADLECDNGVKMCNKHTVGSNANYAKTSVLVSSVVNSQTVTPRRPLKKTDSLRQTPKSPLLRLMSLSQSSLQERTSKALQVGKRIFYKPRVHVITPKKEGQVTLAPRIRKPAQTRIDPYILKRRVSLSPKDRLILSEASSLMKGCHRSSVDSEQNTQMPVPSNRDNATSHCSCKTDSNTDKKNNTEEGGPQHSTPECEKHIPQISILSTISSVASPDNKVLTFSGIRSDSASTLLQVSQRRVLEGANCNRCSLKHLPEMSVINELESTPSHV